MTATAQQLITKLGLQPHHEGGWFREVYRSATNIPAAQGTRSAVTTIYYLLEQARVSPWHVVRSDEIWHFYGGAPAELLSYDPAMRMLERYRLTAASGAGVQVAVIPAGSWQTTRCLGEYTLVGCTVAPGYVSEDFRWVRDLADLSQHFSGDMVGLEAFL
jgi:predicted cupin superfamily sugar epimerase